ncbi:MAG: phage integrase N-terminal SAM-like domain-containing protein [Actinobacteria bacterium]|nr:phage integrase N-terminal SAM-like domain-containing protein [Actinomycetota bacterium]
MSAIRRYILFHGRRHPNSLEPTEVGAFLSDLAVGAGVSARTRTQSQS